MDVADEEVSIATRHFGVGDVHHVVVDEEVDLRRGEQLALQTARAARPHHVLHLVLYDVIEAQIYLYCRHLDIRPRADAQTLSMYM